MRHISFALTTAQIRSRTKTVTRRVGWAFLTPETLLQPVVQAQGLKKGAHVEPIGGPIRVVSVRREPLKAITADDCAREGFADLTREAFIALFERTHQCTADTTVTRIEFEYVNEPDVPNEAGGSNTLGAQ